MVKLFKKRLPATATVPDPTAAAKKEATGGSFSEIKKTIMPPPPPLHIQNKSTRERLRKFVNLKI